MMHSNNPSLQELELELELLKRKRLMLEQQQQMLSGDRRDYDFDQPRQNYNQQEYPYSQLYDSSTGQASGRQFGQKRHAADDKWNQPSKRFFGNPKNKSRKQLGSKSINPWENSVSTSSQGTSSLGSQPPSLFSLNTGLRRPVRPRRPAPPPKSFRRDFKPSKVTKGAPKAPNKLNSYPSSERKNLVEKASDLTKKVDDILRPDVPPNSLVSGRLEYVLGTLLKDLKQKYASNKQYAKLFQIDHVVRTMKQAVRERVRNAMMNKVVDKADTIFKNYREMYPKDKDVEILQFGLKAEKIDKAELLKSDVPNEFFKKHMLKLAARKLDDMFGKLHKLYAEENKNCPTVQDIVDAQLAKIEKEFNIKKDSDEEMEIITQNKEEIDENKEQVLETKEDIKENKEDINENKEGVVDSKEAIDENKEAIDENKDVIGENKETIGENKEAVMDENKETVNDNKEAVTENVVEVDASKEEKIPDATTVHQGDSKVEEDGEKKLNEMEVDKNENVPDDKEKVGGEFSEFNSWKLMNAKFFKADFYERLIDTSLQSSLPALLNGKLKRLVLDTLSKDKNWIRKEILGIEDEDEDIPEKQAEASPKYNVKVIGRPILPEKEQMKEFLNKFNPVHIKKLKYSRNILFVTFKEKKDFDNILAENGVVIGKSTITIALNDKSKQEKITEESESKLSDTSDMKQEKDATESDALNTSNSIDNIITPDISEKIDDVLTSVNEGLENDAENVNETEDDFEQLEKELMEQDEVEDSENVDNPENIEKMQAETVSENQTGADCENEMENGKETDDNNLVINQEETTENDKVAELKSDKDIGGDTPARASARLASSTPSTIRTRRASRLAQNNQ